MLFLVLGRPQGQKVGAFWSNTYQHRKTYQINVPKQGLTTKTNSKCTGTLGGREGTFPPFNTGSIILLIILYFRIFEPSGSKTTSSRYQIMHLEMVNIFGC